MGNDAPLAPALQEVCQHEYLASGSASPASRHPSAVVAVAPARTRPRGVQCSPASSLLDPDHRTLTPAFRKWLRAPLRQALAERARRPYGHRRWRHRQHHAGWQCLKPLRGAVPDRRRGVFTRTQVAESFGRAISGEVARLHMAHRRRLARAEIRDGGPPWSCAPVQVPPCRSRLSPLVL